MTMALEGLRVLDLTQVWAGPTAMKFLGDVGAEVIKVESARRFDSARGNPIPTASTSIYPGGVPGEQPWNRAGHFNDRNRSKRGVCLDLTHPLGVDALKRLVRECDVVAESFRAGVMERLGIGYEELRALKPDIILISLSSQGATGPERSYVSFGATLELTAGLVSITGYDGVPTPTGAFFPDPVVSIFAVGAVLAAIRHRDRTGEGAHIDLSQREVVTSILPEMIMDYTMNGRIAAPIGNRHAIYAPQGVYRCAGDDAWLALTVRSDEEWRALAEAIGDGAAADDGRFATQSGRHEHHDEIDERIGRWTEQRDAYEAMRILQGAGVPAGVAQKGDRLLADPQLAARGFWEHVELPGGEAPPHLSRPFRLSKTPGASRSRAPMLGEHTEAVLREVAGFSDEELAELAAAGVTDNVPFGAPGGAENRA